MTVPITCLESCVNATIAGTMDSLTLTQMSGVSRDFDAGFVKCVVSVADLPDAALNRGRWIYVQSVCGYRFSDGDTWRSDFTGSPSCFDTWAWGSNTSGQLGDNTTSGRSSPVSVLGGITNWCQVSAGLNHSLALTCSGIVWGWGSNGGGRLGDNTTTSRRSPVSVVGGFTNWCQVSAGQNHSLGLRRTGFIWSWGCNNYGQLGDSTFTNSSSPVSAGVACWSRISAGSSHSLAILSSSSRIYATGRNNTGQLGNNTTSNQSTWTIIATFCTDWCGISAGRQASAGVRTNGTIWTWGLNTWGQLGDNTTSDRSSPVSVVGEFTDWCAVSMNMGDNNSVFSDHTLGIRSSGTLWAWGGNSFGKLGDNTTTCTSSPVSVVGGFSNWCQASAGCDHSIAIRSNGSIWSWGRNELGQLGTNNVSSARSPVSVVNDVTGWCQVSAGGHSMAIGFRQGFV